MIYFIIWLIGALIVAVGLLLAYFSKELVVPRDFKNITVGVLLVLSSWISVISFLYYILKDKFTNPN